MKDFEEIGDSFLANNDGFFVAKAFRGVNMAPKYDSLFDSNNNCTVCLGSTHQLCLAQRLKYVNPLKMT